MSIQNILVILRANEEQLRRLQEAAPETHVLRQSVKTLTKEQVEQADVIVGNLPVEFLPHTKGLKLLQLNTAGVIAPYTDMAARQPGTVLCCATGAYGPAVSEHMAASLLTLMKKLHLYRDQQFQGLWADQGNVESPRGKQVLVLGMGDIGTHFASLLSDMGAVVTGIRRRPSQPPAGVQRIASMEELDSLLPQSDIIAMVLPETKDTMNIMNKRRIGLMKPGSYLVNAGRGSAVDQDALVEALESGRLAGAALDVTTPEPLPTEHPLWKQKNALITPHISGNFHLPLTLDLIYEIAANNIRALQGQAEYLSLVDPQSGYRA